jgi:hypothetical protein
VDVKGLFGVRKLSSRLAVALGGFLIFLGIIVVGFFVITVLDVVDVSIIEAENFQNVALVLLLAIGLVDLLAGVMLWRR